MQMLRLALVALAVAMLSGCYTVVRPTIAHVHLGHTLSGWADTPDRVGLLTVAEQEAEIAAEQARRAHQAAKSDRNPDTMKRHVGHVLHALDPTLQPTGAGTGYGFIRAIEGATDHVRFAADSADASRNLKDSITSIEAAASRVRQGAKVAVAISQEIGTTRKQEDLVSLAEELKSQTENLSRQTRAWRGQLQEVIAREDPPYTRIERRYLFGLIRLPNGLWQWHPDVDKAGSQGLGTSGYR